MVCENWRNFGLTSMVSCTGASGRPPPFHVKTICSGANERGPVSLTRPSAAPPAPSHALALPGARAESTARRPRAKYGGRDRWGENTHHCLTCGKSFAKPWLLKRHDGVHMGEKPHSRRLCLTAFSRAEHLKAHGRTHDRK